MAAGNTYVALATNTLSSSAASVTFSSISGAYTDLVLVGNALSLRGTDDSLFCELNSDTGANYSITRLYGNGASVVSNRDVNNSKAIFASNFIGAGSTTFTPFIVNLNNYSNTTTYKTILSRQSYAGGEVGVFVNLWRSTAAISTIKVYAASANLAIGTTFQLFGIAAA